MNVRPSEPPSPPQAPGTPFDLPFAGTFVRAHSPSEAERRDATEAARAALAQADAENDQARRAHALASLACARWAQGDTDVARRLFEESQAAAISAGDIRAAAIAVSNLGVIAMVLGRDADGVRHLECAARMAETGEIRDEAAHALLQLARLHTSRRRFEEADAALVRALGYAGNDVGRGIVLRLEKARLRVRQGERHAALACTTRARMMAEEFGDACGCEGELEQVAGIIARADGDVARAEAHFLAAERIAVSRGDLVLQAETARELCELYRWNGRVRDTLQWMNQAYRLLIELRDRRAMADVDRRVAQFEADYLDVVRRWAESIEEKDVHTHGHCVRVADLASALWTRAGGSDISPFWFRVGAIVHDVGKLMVPSEILNKKGRLTDDEWEVVCRHPTAGVELLGDLDFPNVVWPMVDGHHERWDGRGYPHGREGDQIPLAARVLCIADVYDALTSKRSYKQAFTHDDAIEIMRGDVGAQFDPRLFALFEEIVRRGVWRNTPSGGAGAVHALTR